MLASTLGVEGAVKAARGLAAVAIAVSTLLAAAPARADNPPPPPEPTPPHPDDPSCTLDAVEEPDRDCVPCLAEECADELEPWGYEHVCGSRWSEIWCRDSSSLEEPADRLLEAGCSVARPPARGAQAAGGLALGLVGLLLLATTRRRRG